MRNFQRSRLFAGAAFVAITGVALTSCVTDGVGIATAPIVSEVPHVPKAPSDTETARTHLAAGRPALAIDSLARAIATDPTAVDALNLIGIAYDRLARHDVAQNYYRRALAVEPQSAKTLHNIGYSYYLAQDFEAAERYFDAALPLATGPLADALRGRLLALQDKLPNVGGNRAFAAASPEQTTASASRVVRTGDRTLELHTSPVAVADAAPLRATSPLPQGAQMAMETPAPVPATAPISSTDVPPPRRPAAMETAALTVVAPRFARIPLEISNGAGVRKLAARVSHYLTAQGVRPKFITNADHFNYRQTVIAYQPGYEAAARELASRLPVEAKLVETAGTWSILRLVLGTDIVSFDRTLMTALREAGHSELII